MTDAHPYDGLVPEIILAAVERYGERATGGLLALNSYENRVYRVDTESGPVAAKFYRPQRWSDAAILEEHAFARELADHDIPAVAPLSHSGGSTLSSYAGFRYALFPWQPGRAPELNTSEDYTVLGRYLGRLHRLGAAAPFTARQTLTIEGFGHRSVTVLLESGFIPDYLREIFRGLAQLLLPQIESLFAAAGQVLQLRLHGDCHLSNILWSETGPHLVDFDDCLTGPSIQDLWMLLSGARADMERQLADVLTGYSQFAEFNPAELRLIEPLRTLRILRYNAWLAQRWDDPAFPHNFPWFTSQRFWEEQIQALREQQALLNEPPLTWRQD